MAGRPTSLDTLIVGDYIADRTAPNNERIFGNQMAELLPQHRDCMSPYAVDFAEQGRRSTIGAFLRAIEQAGRIYASFGPMITAHDVLICLICPTTALPAVPADVDHGRDEILLNGRRLTLNPPMLAWGVTTPFNTLSHRPVLAMPARIGRLAG